MTVQPPDYCHYEGLAAPIEWMVAILVPTNSWLFFTRVRGIYSRSRTVIILFAILWATTLSALCLPFSYTIKSFLDESGQCKAAFHRSQLLPIPLVVLVAFDTAVLIAISIHLTMYDPSVPLRSRVRSIIEAKNMGRISRTLLRSGQIY